VLLCELVLFAIYFFFSGAGRLTYVPSDAVFCVGEGSVVSSPVVVIVVIQSLSNKVLWGS
jgi:hypothetical protein